MPLKSVAVVGGDRNAHQRREFNLTTLLACAEDFVTCSVGGEELISEKRHGRVTPSGRVRRRRLNAPFSSVASSSACCIVSHPLVAQEEHPQRVGGRREKSPVDGRMTSRERKPLEGREALSREASRPKIVALQKIHVLPVGQDAPRKDLFRELKKYMKKRVVLQRHMPIYVRNRGEAANGQTTAAGGQGPVEKAPSKGKDGDTLTESGGEGLSSMETIAVSDLSARTRAPPDDSAQPAPSQDVQRGSGEICRSKVKASECHPSCPSVEDAAESFFHYVVVECIPSNGIITSDTLVFTEGLPLGHLRKVQFLALATPDTVDGRQAGFVAPGERSQTAGQPRSSQDCPGSDGSRALARRQSRRRAAPPEGETRNCESEVVREVSDASGPSNDTPERNRNLRRSLVSQSSAASRTGPPRTIRMSDVIPRHSGGGRCHEPTTTQELSKANQDMCSVEESLFRQYIAPYYKGRAGCVVYPGKKLIVKDVAFVIWSTEPSRLPGFINSETDIYVTVDPWGEYSKIHIVPFIDTLPSNYEYDLFADYLRPFLNHSPWRLFRKNDIFSYGGVQFKVVATEPRNPANFEGAARIGPQTIIHFEGSTSPSVMDILPPDVLRQIRTLPARIQPFAIISAVNTLDPESLMRVIPHRGGHQGLRSDVLQQIKSQLVQSFELAEYSKKFPELCEQRRKGEAKAGDVQSASDKFEVTSPSKSEDTPSYRKERPGVEEGAAISTVDNSTGNSNTAPETSPQDDSFELDAPACTVCTTEMADGDDSLIFPCGHVFHWQCVQSWLRTGHTCPNCRRDIRELLDSSDCEAGNQQESPQQAQGSGIGFVADMFGDFLSF